jgi:hypothetical protein
MRRLEEAEFEPQILKNGKLQFRIRQQDLYESQALLRDLLHQAVKEYQAAG